MNRFSIADRILSEYEKHSRLPDNAWAHIAAAKIIAQMREEDQAELDKQPKTLTDGPVAWTTKTALSTSERLAGSPFEVITASSRNLWGELGVPLYLAPAAGLTDKECKSIAAKRYPFVESESGRERYHKACLRAAYSAALMDARDNGYLAPAAGLTVDVTEIVQIAAVCAADAWSGYVPSGQSVGSPSGKFRNDFRASLEAALKAKQQ